MPTQYYENGVKQTAAFCLSYQDQNGHLYFLLGQRNGRGKLVFPGGGVDNEDNNKSVGIYEYAAKREFLEETGIDVHCLPKNIETKRYAPEAVQASGGYGAKTIHYYGAHLGKLNDEAILKLKQAIKTNSDLENAEFRCFVSWGREIQFYNRQIMNDVRNNNPFAQAQDNSSKVLNWLSAAQTRSHHLAPTHSQLSAQNKLQPSHSLNLWMLGGIMMVAAGVGLLLLGLITLNPIGLIGIAPLLGGLGFFQLSGRDAPNTQVPTQSCQMAS